MTPTLEERLHLSSQLKVAMILSRDMRARTERDAYRAHQTLGFMHDVTEMRAYGRQQAAEARKRLSVSVAVTRRDLGLPYNEEAAAVHDSEMLRKGVRRLRSSVHALATQTVKVGRMFGLAVVELDQQAATLAGPADE